MASTEPVQQPATNGVDSDEEDTSKLRPVDIEQDMREMERRKRVEAIMSSKLFREELERVVTDSLRDSGADGISDMLSNMLNVRPAAAGGAFRPSVIPINDIRGLEGMNFSKSEKLLRCKLASVYRLIDMYGWAQSIYNHVTVSCQFFISQLIVARSHDPGVRLPAQATIFTSCHVILTREPS